MNTPAPRAIFPQQGYTPLKFDFLQSVNIQRITVGPSAPSVVAYVDLRGLESAQVFRIMRGDTNRTGIDPNDGKPFIEFKDGAVSRMHAEVVYSPADQRLIVRDQGSTNGTCVDGVKFQGEMRKFRLAGGKQAFELQVGHSQIMIVPLLRKVPDATPPHPYEALRLVPPLPAQPHPLLGKEPKSVNPPEDVFFKIAGSTPGRGDLLVRFPAGTPDRAVDLVSDYLRRSTNLDRSGHPTVNLEIDWYSAREFYEDSNVKLLTLRGVRFDVKNGIVLLKGEEGRTVEMDFRAASNGIIGAIRPNDLRGTPVVRILLPWPEVSTPQSELGLLTQLRNAFQRINGYLDRPEFQKLGGIFLV
jgi:hypothetical protein